LDTSTARAYVDPSFFPLLGTNSQQTIAAILLLNLPTPSATFQALSNILNRPLPLSFHTSDPAAISRTYTLVLSNLKHKSPRLHDLLSSPHLGPQPDAYMRDLFASLFTGPLNLDNATRLWDVVVFEGDAVLVRAAVAFLVGLEGKLFGATNPRNVVEIIREHVDALGEEEWMEAVRRAGKPDRAATQ
jgi:hypothetical protein